MVDQEEANGFNSKISQLMEEQYVTIAGNLRVDQFVKSVVSRTRYRNLRTSPHLFHDINKGYYSYGLVALALVLKMTLTFKWLKQSRD
jgi:hypothetical protein